MYKLSGICLRIVENKKNHYTLPLSAHNLMFY